MSLLPAEQDLLYEKEGALGWITVNRPEQRNAFTFEMYDRLHDLCEEIDADDAVRVVILRGAGGKSFAAGTDIRQFLNFTTEEHALWYEETVTKKIGRVGRLLKPTIALIEGYCVGGGFSLALNCDLRYCAPDSRFGAPPAKLGNVFAPMPIYRMLMQVGPARTKEMIFTGRLVEAQEMYEMGFVNGVVPRESLEAKVREVAAAIAQNAPLTIRSTKEQVLRMMDEMAPKWRGEEYVLRCYMSGDFKEGVRAFLEKRQPQWKGR